MKELCFDISTWQGGISYTGIRNRVNYCILRAGFSFTEDNQFENHYANLQGLNLGAYWYSYATSPEEARQEARHFLSVIGDKKFTLPLFLDLEDPSIRGIGRNTLNEIVKAFGEVIENAGYYFAVYTNLDWYRNVISGSELNQRYDWWIACWGDEPPSVSYGINYGVWQYTNSYDVDGYRVDANFVYKDYPTIIKDSGLNHLGGDTPTPTPTPTDFNIGDRVLVSGVATEDSNGGGGTTAEYTGNPNDPDDIRYITLIEDGASRPYHISVGNTLGDGDRGWVSANQISKI